MRSAFVAGLQSTRSLWRLDLDSELLFVGDAGTTEANHPNPAELRTLRLSLRASF